MKEKKVIMSAKLTKVGRAYSESVKRKIVGEINCGLLSHTEASKKYGVIENLLLIGLLSYHCLI